MIESWQTSLQWKFQNLEINLTRFPIHWSALKSLCMSSFPVMVYIIRRKIKKFKHIVRFTREETPQRTQSRSQSLRSPWPAVGKRQLWEQPFQACAIEADCSVKPDGQNSVISKCLLPELSFSDRWSTGTKTLGTRLQGTYFVSPCGHDQLV